MKPHVYAIDFGTSNSLLAASSLEEVIEPIPLDTNQKDPTILKSLFYTRDLENWSFGSEAITEYEEWGNEGRLFRSLKRFLPEPGFKGTTILDRFVKIEELISVFLRHMRQCANQYFDTDVTRVMLGRPALFSLDLQKDQLAESRLRRSAKLAGFKEVEFCKEPVAAGLDFREQLEGEKVVLIADFGGGTSDFTIIKMSKDEIKNQDVLALNGLSLAGDAFDGLLMKEEIAPYFGTEIIYRLPMGNNDLKLPRPVVDRLCSPAGIMFLNQQDILETLRHAQYWSLTPVNQERMNRLFVLIEEQLGYQLFRSVEATKIALSSQEMAPFIFNYPGIEIEETIKATQFILSSRVLVDQIVHVLDETLKQAGLSHHEIDLVCLTGGTAYLPAIQHALNERFTKDKLVGFHHFHSIILGLAQMSKRWVNGESLF